MALGEAVGALMAQRLPISRLPNLGDLPLPSYATSGAVGLDLAAAIDDFLVIRPRQTVKVPTGIAIALPVGLEAQVRSRSGLAAKHNVVVLNSPGTIDEDYRGEIGVLLINHGDEPFTITRGMRIAQLVIAKYERVELDDHEVLSTTTRGGGGFGSTGTTTLQ